MSDDTTIPLPVPYRLQKQEHGALYCLLHRTEPLTSVAIAEDIPAEDARAFAAAMNAAQATVPPFRGNGATHPGAAGQPVTLTYTNWRGETAEREITPTGGILFTSNEWHPEPQWHVEARDAQSGEVRLFALKGFGAAGQPVSGSGGVDDEAGYMAKAVAEQVKENESGFWRACSGCQESSDGHVSEKLYPYSRIFMCQPGCGCSECGGIGVVWDNVDYSALGDALAKETAAPIPPAMASGGPTRDRLAEIIGSFPLFTATAEPGWLRVIGDAFEGGPEKRTEAVYQLVDEVLAEFSLASAMASGVNEEALEVARRWESWYEGIVADFVGVTDRPSDPDRVHDWSWVDAHRPPPERYSPAEPWAATASGGAAVTVEDAERLFRLALDATYQCAEHSADDDEHYEVVHARSEAANAACIAAFRSLAAQQDKDGVWEAVDVLRSLEWSSKDDLGNTDVCPVCEATAHEAQGHHVDGCCLAAALNTAATADQPGREGEGSTLPKPDRDWAYRFATRRQGQSSTPRCEPPSEYDIDKALKFITWAMETAPSPAPRQDGEPEVEA